MKKILSVLLSAAMLLGVFQGMSFTAFAETSGDYKYTVLSDGTVEITEYTGTTTADLYVPHTIDGRSVSAIGDYAFIGKGQPLSDISLPSTVESIGVSAFANCSTLYTVNLPENLKSLGDNAFAGCTHLETVGTIGKYVSGITSGTFASCDKLKEFSVSGENENYSSQDGVLFNKSKTELIRYPSGSSNSSYVVPDGVETIKENAFFNASALKEITIPLSVKTVEDNAFLSASGLENVCIYTTEEQFKNTIVSSSGNEKLLKAKITHTHTSDVDPAVEPTCTTTGLTEGSHCSVCGEVIVAQQTVPATDHTKAAAVKENEVSAACTQNGSYDSVVYCSVCHTELSRDKVTVPATCHNFVSGQQYCLNGCGTVNPDYVAPSKQPASVSKPKPAKLKKVAKGKRSFTVQWKKVKNVSGYQIQYSTNKKMKKAKTKNVKGSKKTKVTVKKLKKGKKYYVRIRTYKTVGGKKVYSKWSAKKTVKTK